MNDRSEVKMDDADSCSGKSTSSGGESSTEGKLTSINGAGSSNGDEKIKENLSKKETSQVNLIRCVLYAVLISSAIAISVVVFLITRNAQQTEYQTQYEGASAKIISSFETVISKIGSVYSVGLAATIEGYDISTNGTNLWPFVTLPSFAQRAASARDLSDALLVSIQPIVSEFDRNSWETYSFKAGRDWITDGLNYQNEMGIEVFDISPTPLDELLNYSKKPIFYIDSSGHEITSVGKERYIPSWQASPVLKQWKTNLDLLQESKEANVVVYAVNKSVAVFGPYHLGPPGYSNSSNSTTSLIATLRSMQEHQETVYLGAPTSNLYLPVFDSFDVQNRRVVATMMSIIHWRSYFFDVLPDSVRGIVVVLENTCYGMVTFDIDGAMATTRCDSDAHDSKYDIAERAVSFETLGTISDGTKSGLQIDPQGCVYKLHVYPSQTFEDSYITPMPFWIMFAVAMVFLFTMSTFLLFNRLVEKRQKALSAKAAQSEAIVSSMFPKQVRDRLMQDQDGLSRLAPTTRLKSFLINEGGSNDQLYTGVRQLADLFPNCTVLFADISGFTAWSSTRGPDEVFILLQTVYHGFDEIAKRRKVFKVETIGDSYLAVTGLPDPQTNHAIIMARFAWECKKKMREMMKQLEIMLGPDCSDLLMRFGMHSGPVTAGVLRGDRARFQLFGDTVNTASRIESTGIKNRIHISQVTADLIIAGGKGHWVTPREDIVDAKGKGILRTYWLKAVSIKDNNGTSDTASNSDGAGGSSVHEHEDVVNAKDIVKHNRLVDWMVELLLDHLRKMMARRRAIGIPESAKESHPFFSFTPEGGRTCLDEVQDVIRMVEYDSQVSVEIENSHSIEIDREVVDDLRDYVALIANMYRDENPFHNFDHACHVAMSVNKLLKRIVAPEVSKEQLEGSDTELAAHLHSHTYGITSDPLALFSIVFSALIHDVDHRGCSNGQLIKEEPHLGARYKEKSVAEQNSLDIAWNLLMSDRFQRLRTNIFESQEELLRFRSFIVCAVLATDIFDKELNDLRKKRWVKAFSETASDDVDYFDRKATIVIEHIIQASDVSHTMQHWHVYVKWNSKLFKELYQGFLAGRMAVDPSTFWYQGEISFFDNYVIPLAKKLKECSVFGVSSDEYLTYAVGNRSEWLERGEAIVADIMDEISKEQYKTDEQAD